MSLTHIETIELGSSQSSITFSSIPQDYDDLVLVHSPRTDRAATGDTIIVYPNGSSANGSIVTLFGNGSSVGSFTDTRLFVGEAPGATATANTFGNNSVYFSNYTSSSNKSISVDAVGENNATAATQSIRALLWSNTAAITSLELVPSSGINIVTGSTFSLFGVTAGGSGTVTTS